MAERDVAEKEGEEQPPEGRCESADYVVAALRNLSDATRVYPQTEELDDVVRALMEARQQCFKVLRLLKAKGILTPAETVARDIASGLRRKLERAAALNDSAKIQAVVDDLRRYELGIGDNDPLPPPEHPFPEYVAELERAKAHLANNPRLAPAVELLERFVGLGAKAGMEDLEALIRDLNNIVGEAPPKGR